MKTNEKRYKITDFINMMGRGDVICVEYDDDSAMFKMGDVISYNGHRYKIRFIEQWTNGMNGKPISNRVGLLVKRISNKSDNQIKSNTP